MSTIKANKLEHTSTASGGIQLDNAGHVTVDGQQMPTTGPLSNRNLVINGGMTVSQRGTSFTHTTASQFTVDRFSAANGSSFNWNSAVITQSSDGPDGFANSLKVDVASTSTPTGSHNACFKHLIEAQDLQQLGFGSSEAQSFTLSFWVKSNKTGAYSVQVLQSDADKYLLSEYTISSSNTWEHKTLTFVGNTANVIDDDNGAGFELRFNLACGSSDITTPKSTWTAAGGGTILASTNQVNLFDNANNEWYMTGVQLEVGAKSTSFEHRSHGDELQRCLRYTYVLGSENVTDNFERFDMGIANSSTGTRIFVKHPVVMRTAPTVSTPDATQFQVSDTSNGYDASAIARMSNVNGPLQTSLQITHDSGTTASRPYIFERNNSTSGRITFSAEL